MKRILLLIVPVAVMALSGCTKKTTSTPPVQETPLASSTPQNKNVVLEDFTGIQCGYCPDGHIRAKAFADANPGRVFIICDHSGIYATPVPTWGKDYTTQYGEAIRAQAKVAGYPAGTINRHVFTSPQPMMAGGMALGRGDWQTAGAQIMAQAAPVNIGLKTTWDEASRTLSVTAETYYTADETVENDLNIAITESGIVGAQEDYTTPKPYIVYNYVQNNMMRTLLTGQWGDPISGTKTGNRVKKTYQYTVPADYNIDNLNVVAYVTEGHIEILNGAQMKAH